MTALEVAPVTRLMGTGPGWRQRTIQLTSPEPSVTATGADSTEKLGPGTICTRTPGCPDWMTRPVAGSTVPPP